MANGYEDVQKIMKDSMDTAVRSAGVITKSIQAIATETTDYSKKSVEEGSKYVESLFGAKSVETMLELQTVYMKKAYEDAVGQFTKMGAMYTELAKEMAKPYEGFAAKFPK
jgi:hypothetical protein